jgi:hypothetical protein
MYIAKVTASQRVIIDGLSGVVRSALPKLCRLKGAEGYMTASKGTMKKCGHVRVYGGNLRRRR